MKTIVIASSNPGKIREIRDTLSSLSLRLLSLKDFPSIPDLIEDGKSYEENALIKAKAVLQATGEWALGDDSGVEVDYLNGAPGLHSARFAGSPVNWGKNNQKILDALRGIPRAQRGARFVTVLALCRPGERELFFEGSCQGFILEDLRGTNGFGYDPLFFYPPLNKSFGEMSPSEKNHVSHRVAALNKLKIYIQKLL